MIVGVPRERKTLEKRVALTPDGAALLVKHKHRVLIETNAGQGSFFDDAQYKAAGCEIVPTLKDVWSKSDLVVKVKEPHESEYEYFRPGLMLFDYLHLASMPSVASALIKGKVSSIGYELVQLPDGRLPLLEPMSEVAGRLSVMLGAFYLLQQNGGRGVLLSGTVGVPPAEVVILGAGISGRGACEVAAGMGAHVTVLDIDYLKLDRVRTQFGAAVWTVHSSPGTLARAMERADLVVGAVLVPGAAAPKIISREMIRAMKPGSVFVDISIDQGGCAETSRPTSLDNPVYVEDGVIHYGVCNMPAQTPRTSTQALTAATLPYIVKLADGGMDALTSNQPLRMALNTHNGMLTNKLVSDAVGLPYTAIDKALAG